MINQKSLQELYQLYIDLHEELQDSAGSVIKFESKGSGGNVGMRREIAAHGCVHFENQVKILKDFLENQVARVHKMPDNETFHQCYRKPGTNNCITCGKYLGD